MMDSRQQKGQAIAQLQGQIKRVDKHNYSVKSQSGNGDYKVLATEFGWVCSCPDHINRGVACKHIYATQISLEFRKVVQLTKIEPLTDVTSCIHCSSNMIVRDGVRHNKHGNIQKFNCKACSRY